MSDDATLELFAPAGAGLLGGEGPRWFTLAAHRPFLDDLAAGLLAELEPQGPQALSDAVVLTPTRRGARALAEAFVRAGGGRALLLPQIRALGDLDEGEPPFEPPFASSDLALGLPPAVTPLRRRFELARLVVAHEGLLARRLDAAAALELADALAAFLDGVQIEERMEPRRLETLVEGELAGHWRRSADFLKVALEAWPARLAELGLADVAQRRTALLRALAAQWRDSPPAGPLLAAGSTGSAPATADLLAVIARAPCGAVVLPGLDIELDREVWDLLHGPQGEAHPQGAMARLLARAGVLREAVRAWPVGGDAAEARRGAARAQVVNEALRPPETTADWLSVAGRLRGAAPHTDNLIREGLAGLTVRTAHTEEDAAAQAAVLLREALETPGKTCALVTPDAALARRVAARLSRWRLEADSSAGASLASFPAGVLLTLVARAVEDPLDPATLLAIAKHPLAQLGGRAATLDRARRDLERRTLRGPRPTGWAEMTAALDARELPEAVALARALQAAIEHARAPFSVGAAPATAPATALATAPAPVAARALAEALEMIGSDADGRLGELWAGPGGEAAAALVSALIEDGAALPDPTPSGFAELVAALAAGETVRTGGALHPRLQILGAIEARLVRADRLVLAGLEEGTWPRGAGVDPFLSRPMRAALGLPPPERRTGLSAHDFAQAASSPEVVMIHAERRDGQPAVKSRWLWRLETLARGAGEALPSRPEVALWARGLDAPLADPPPELKPARRPRPRPPVEARPREMAVTRIEEWLRDPYSTYARYILSLRALDRPDAPVEARVRGSAVHKAFELFATEHPELSADPAADFERLLVAELERAGVPVHRMARERPLARRLAAWVAGFERERRAGATLMVEGEGRLVIAAPYAPFVVTARADRLERRPGGVDILDFKTGAAPSKKQVESGFAPQLTLTAAILGRGGFEGLEDAAAGELLYVRVSGRRTPGEALVRGERDGHARDLAERALAGLADQVARFDDPNTAYSSWTAPQFIATRRSDYDHLARLWEWHVMGEGDDGAEA